MRPQNCIIYEGPSMLDGKPIVAVSTGLGRKSRNPKTGNMVQVWIIRADVDPVTAAEDGQDASICGACVHRADAKGRRTCYVSVWQAPGQVYAAFRAGKYSRVPSSKAPFRGRMVRVGAYGDPAAVPEAVWFAYLATAKGWTGYTHQWADLPTTSKLREIVMASCETRAQQSAAIAMGWRAFRVRTPLEEIRGADSGKYREITCPASDESGNRTTCEHCGLCNGKNGAGDTRANITILAHGRGAAEFNRRAQGALRVIQ